MPNLPILMYHSVPGSRRGDSDLEVAEADFRAQVGFLREAGYRSITLRDLARVLDGRDKLPAKPVVFTFDDGLRSVQDQALPILRAAGFTAVVYVVAGQIGGHNAWDHRQGLPREECMDEAALRMLQRAGWEIGSHGMDHLDLTRLPDGALRRELGGSKARLEERFGPVESFCYPYAAHCPRVRLAVQQAGYSGATVNRMRSWSVTADRFLMKRVFVRGSESLAAFRRKVSAWYLGWRSLART